VTELLNHAFAFVCGQNPEHTWVLGGCPLPCCQRCTGLYIGALAATLLHAWLKPRLTDRFLAAHGLALMQMIPFGLHWLPQGAELRTATGLVFGFGIVTFLRLVPAAQECVTRNSRRRPTWTYGFGFAGSLALLLSATVLGGSAAAVVLSVLAFGGAVALAMAALANVLAGLRALRRRFRRPVTGASA
jgi:uncharacterized membrane protein